MVLMACTPSSVVATRLAALHLILGPQHPWSHEASASKSLVGRRRAIAIWLSESPSAAEVTDRLRTDGHPLLLLGQRPNSVGRHHVVADAPNQTGNSCARW